MGLRLRVRNLFLHFFLAEMRVFFRACPRTTRLYCFDAQSPFAPAMRTRLKWPMPGNSIGQALRLSTAGESHGPANVAILDGVPPGIPLTVEDLLVDLDRRRPGQ